MQDSVEVAPVWEPIEVGEVRWYMFSHIGPALRVTVERSCGCSCTPPGHHPLSGVFLCVDANGKCVKARRGRLFKEEDIPAGVERMGELA